MQNLSHHHQLRSRAAVQNNLTSLRTVAHAATTAEASVKNHEEALTALRTAHPDLASIDVHRVSVYRAALLAVLGVWVIDVLLFKQVAEHFVGMSYGQVGGWVATFLLPAAILMLEAFLNSQRIRAHQVYLQGDGSRGPEIGWLLAAVLLSLVMPAAVIANVIAGEQGTSSNSGLSAVAGSLIVAFAGLSFICHIAILFGGSLLLEAKAYLGYRRVEARTGKALKEAGEQASKNLEAISATLASYFASLEAHNQRFADSRLQPGPFDDVTRKVVNRIHGYELIQVPKATATQATGPEPQAPPAAAWTDQEYEVTA